MFETLDRNMTLAAIWRAFDSIATSDMSTYDDSVLGCWAKVTFTRPIAVDVVADIVRAEVERKLGSVPDGFNVILSNETAHISWKRS